MAGRNGYRRKALGQKNNQRYINSRGNASNHSGRNNINGNLHCNHCGRNNHLTKDCRDKPRNGGNGGRRNLHCNNCGKNNHLTKDCRAKKGGNFKGCFKCGKEGHRAAECRNGIVCFNCGENGHKSTDCTKPKQQKGHQSRNKGPKPITEKMCYKCGKTGHVRSECKEERNIANRKLPEPQKKWIAQSFKNLPRDEVKNWLPGELEHVVEVVRLCEVWISSKATIRRYNLEVVEISKEKKKVTFRKMSNGTTIDLEVVDTVREVTMRSKLTALQEELIIVKRMISETTDKLFEAAERAENEANVSFVPDECYNGSRSSNVREITRQFSAHIGQSAPAAKRIGVLVQWVHNLLRETNRLIPLAENDAEEKHMVAVSRKAARASTSSIDNAANGTGIGGPASNAVNQASNSTTALLQSMS